MCVRCRTMGTPAGGALRVIRTVAITAVIVGLAATAHVAGGGAVPRPLGTAGVVLGTAYVCGWLARRRLSATAIAALLVAGQWTLHHAFDLLQTSVCVPAGRSLHSATHVAEAGCVPGPVTAVEAHAVTPSWLMLAAHAVATVVTAVVLATGERALWSLCGLLAALRPALPRPLPAVVAGPAPVPHAAPPARPRRAVLLRVSPRRGPPAPLPGPLARLA
jgi:hypothetical protein